MTHEKNINIKEGLDALFLISKNKHTEVSVTNNGRELIFLPLNTIVVNRFQPRLKIASNMLNELVASIKAIGVLQPIIVRQQESKYEIIAGERRWRAAAIAGLASIPAIVYSATDEEVAAFALIENLQREDLNPIEEALGYRKLIEEFSLKHEDIAYRVGKSRATITNMLRLLNLMDEVKNFLQDKKLEMGHARALLALNGNDQIKAAQIIVDQDLSVRATEKLVHRIKNPLPLIIPANEDIIKKANNLSKQLSDKLSSKVNIKVRSKGEGRVVINFSSLDEVEWLLGKLT